MVHSIKSKSSFSSHVQYLFSLNTAFIQLFNKASCWIPALITAWEFRSMKKFVIQSFNNIMKLIQTSTEEYQIVTGNLIGQKFLFIHIHDYGTLNSYFFQSAF